MPGKIGLRALTATERQRRWREKQKRRLSQTVLVERVIEVVLLFYSACWTAEKSRRWLEMTGRDEVTTKSMCDWLREVRGQLDGGDREWPTGGS
jgi:hypothetical protein